MHIMQKQGRYSQLTDGGRYSQLTDGSTHAESDDKSMQSKCEADTSNSQMGPLMPRVTTRTYNVHKRQIQPTHRWVHSCQEGQQKHITQTRGRYSPLTDGSTHAESDDKSIQSKCEADTSNSQMGPLMPRVTTRTYNAHKRQIQPTHRWVHSCREGQEHIMQTRGRYRPLTDGFNYAEKDNKNI